MSIPKSPGCRKPGGSVASVPSLQLRRRRRKVWMIRRSRVMGLLRLKLLVLEILVETSSQPSINNEICQTRQKEVSCHINREFLTALVLHQICKLWILLLLFSGFWFTSQKLLKYACPNLQNSAQQSMCISFRRINKYPDLQGVMCGFLLNHLEGADWVQHHRILRRLEGVP